MKAYLIDVKNDRLYTLKQLGELFGLALNTMKGRKTDGNVPESIKVCGQEVYPTTFVNEYILQGNPKLLEKVATATQINDAITSVVKVEG